MRTIETVVYNFDELTEDAKNKAVEGLFLINVDLDWWDATYEDAEQVGLILTGFDLGRGEECNGVFKWSAKECANLILDNHGHTCDTFKEANDWAENKRIEHHLTDPEEIDNNFLEAILFSYLNILKKEYQYKISDEAIIETIQCNEWEFTEDGKMI